MYEPMVYSLRFGMKTDYYKQREFTLFEIIRLPSLSYIFSIIVITLLVQFITCHFLSAAIFVHSLFFFVIYSRREIVCYLPSTPSYKKSYSLRSLVECFVVS